MTINLEDKVIVVTGGGSGVGRELCKLFAADGAQVVIADINQPASEATAAMLQGKHPGLVMALDVSSVESWQAFQDEIKRIYGRLDVLCNNAGVSRFGAIDKAPLEDWQLQSRINIDGPVLGCKTFVPDMIEQGSGIVVNTASLSGLLPMAEASTYTASKFAVVGFSLSLQAELAGKGIQVYTLCPGGIDTPMTQNDAFDFGEDDRLISPVEVATKVLETIKANDNRKFIFTHPEAKEILAAQYQSIIAEHIVCNSLV